MSQGLLKQNQKTYKQSFNKNYKIYKGIMSSINVNLKLISDEKEMIKKLSNCQNEFVNKASTLKNAIDVFMEKLKTLDSIELNGEELQDYITFVKAKKQLDDIYKIKESLLSKEEKNKLMQKHEYLQGILDNFTVLQLDKFESHYERANEVKVLNLELNLITERLDKVDLTIQNFQNEISKSLLLNKTREEELGNEKISRLNHYVAKIKNSYNKFTLVNKVLYSKKMKNVQTKEIEMTF